jgi:hypothetical protein
MRLDTKNGGSPAHIGSESKLQLISQQQKRHTHEEKNIHLSMIIFDDFLSCLLDHASILRTKTPIEHLVHD